MAVAQRGLSSHPPLCFIIASLENTEWHLVSKGDIRYYCSTCVAATARTFKWTASISVCLSCSLPGVLLGCSSQPCMPLLTCVSGFQQQQPGWDAVT